MLSFKELLTDAGRKLLFLVERVFLPMGRSNCCIMQIRNAQQQGERRPKSREKILHPNLSCLAIKYEFHFTIRELVTI